MIKFDRFELENGLKVLVHTDLSSPMVAVNMLYQVGSRNEKPEKTGFAHLFEHLMFGGSKNAPSFDDPIQLAGGESNAFTNSDITNFYCTIPAQNLETVLWLEADRMENLLLNEKSLDTQRNVVVEEFKETSINQPYGDVWHLLSDLAFKKHPYRWPTIGIEPSHIAEANLEDVASFYSKFYGPNNAILVLSGNIEAHQGRSLVNKWFGHIARRELPSIDIPNEPTQVSQRRLKAERPVPTSALYLAFHMCGRKGDGYASIDILSDVLASGKSSFLYQRLHKKKRVCNAIDAYITGTMDAGLFIVEAKPARNISLAQLEEAIWEELDGIGQILVEEKVLEKLKNKIENSLEFSGTSVMNKAMNIAYYEWMGRPELVNEEFALYQSLTTEDVQRAARQVLRRENCSILEYVAQESMEQPEIYSDMN